MGFDMRILKVNKNVLQTILDKYYTKNINDLHYVGYEELKNNINTKIFESRLDLLSPFEKEGCLPYASDTYAELSPQLVIALIEWTNKMCEVPYKNSRYSIEYKRLKDFFDSLNGNSEEDIIFYEYDC